MPVSYKFFQKMGEKGSFFNVFSKACRIANPERDIIRKENDTNILHEIHAEDLCFLDICHLGCNVNIFHAHHLK